jgi:hypothetical protein
MQVKFDLVSPHQGHEVFTTIWHTVKENLIAGNKMQLIIKSESKNREQEEKYHAMIKEISDQASHIGAKWSADDWKRLLIHEFMKTNTGEITRIIPSLSGDGIVQLGFQSREFTKKQSSEFIEFLSAWGADKGIVFNE